MHDAYTARDEWPITRSGTPSGGEKLACQLLSITVTLLYNLAQFETTDLQAAKAVLEELGKKGVSHDDDA